jgi:FHA domain
MHQPAESFPRSAHEWGVPTPPPRPPTTHPTHATARTIRLPGRTLPPPIVAGTLCVRDHLNEPGRSSCNLCGIDIDAVAPVVQRARPPLGRLVFDTGQAYVLACDVLIGRRSGDDSLVTSGHARSLVPAGDASSISRAHALVRLSGWRIELIDLGSLNGTFLWDRAATTWTRADPHVAVPITVGDSIAFGRRAARLDPPGR